MAANYDNYQGYLTGYGAKEDYEIVSGVVHIPLAENPPTDLAALAVWSPVVPVQVHASYRRRTMHWKATKQGGPPIIPSPISTGKFSFEGGVIEFQTPRADGTFGKFDWTVSGAYHFIEVCRHSNEDGFILGVPATTLTTQAANAQNYTTSFPPLGAISAGGNDALYGYRAAKSNDVTAPNWIYNTISFFPGELLNDYVANGHVIMLPTDIGATASGGGNAAVINPIPSA